MLASFYPGSRILGGVGVVSFGFCFGVFYFQAVEKLLAKQSSPWLFGFAFSMFQAFIYITQKLSSNIICNGRTYPIRWPQWLTTLAVDQNCLWGSSKGSLDPTRRDLYQVPVPWNQRRGPPHHPSTAPLTCQSPFVILEHTVVNIFSRVFMHAPHYFLRQNPWRDLIGSKDRVRWRPLIYMVREKDGGRSRWWPDGAPLRQIAGQGLSSSQWWANSPRWRALFGATPGVVCGFPPWARRRSYQTQVTAASQRFGFMKHDRPDGAPFHTAPGAAWDPVLLNPSGPNSSVNRGEPQLERQRWVGNSYSAPQSSLDSFNSLAFFSLFPTGKKNSKCSWSGVSSLVFSPLLGREEDGPFAEAQPYARSWLLPPSMPSAGDPVLVPGCCLPSESGGWFQRALLRDRKWDGKGVQQRPPLLPAQQPPPRLELSSPLRCFTCDLSDSPPRPLNVHFTDGW